MTKLPTWVFTSEAQHGTGKSGPGKGDSFCEPSFSGSTLKIVKLRGSIHFQIIPIPISLASSIALPVTSFLQGHRRTHTEDY